MASKTKRVLKKDEETICCGICSCSFKSRMELYRHFQSRHRIDQEFRGYQFLGTNTDSSDKNSHNGASVTKVIHPTTPLRTVQGNHINARAPAPAPIVPNLHSNGISNLQTVVPAPIVSQVHSNGTSNLPTVAPAETEHRNLALTTQTSGSSKVTQKTVSGNCVTSPILNVPPTLELIGGLPKKPTTTLHYRPTSTDLSAGNFKSFPSLHAMIKLEPFSGVQVGPMFFYPFNGQQRMPNVHPTLQNTPTLSHQNFQTNYGSGLQFYQPWMNVHPPFLNYGNDVDMITDEFSL